MTGRMDEGGYIESGGQGRFSDFYTAVGRRAFRRELTKQCHVARHNLGHHGRFNRVHSFSAPTS